MKKIPISFNDELEAKEKELAKLLGITGSYGEVPAVVRFSINYTLARLKEDYKFIPDLKEGEIEIWYSSIKRLKEQEKTKKEIKKLEKKGESYTSESYKVPKKLY